MDVLNQTIEVISSLPYPLCIKSSTSARYLATNPAFCKLFSFDSDQMLIGKTDKELVKKNSQLQEVFAESKGEVVIGGNCYRIDKKLLQQEQAYLYTLTPMDEPARLREALHHSKMQENFLLDVIACMPGNVYWLDRRGRFQGCNDNVAKMLGFTSNKEIIGLRHEDTARIMGWDEGQAESFRHDDLKVLQTGKGVFGIEEPPINNAGGETIYYLTSRVPLLDHGGGVAGVVGISVDITERRRAEVALTRAKQEADEANQAKSEFLAMMTHELRTPLNVILGMAQIMQTEECDRDKQLDLLQTIFNSGKSLLGLINDILDFSKAQAGKLQVNPEPFELSQLLHQLQKEFSVKGQENNVAYQVKADPNLPRYLLADSQRLRQIIYNLSDNALKFTNNGTVTLVVDKVPAEQAGCLGIKVQVQDTGLGIPEEKLHSVFDEFTQVSTKKHTEYSRRYGGVGLGLAIVRQLIDLMGAKISVASELEVGTTFTCEFEFKQPTPEQLKELEAESAKHAGPIKSLRVSKVLLVEDNLLNQRVAAHMMQRYNCEVEIVGNGAEALAKMKSPYDLVFMDMTLPDMSGIEVTTSYRAEEGKGRHQPIIALTANVHEDDKKACMDAGMDGFLTKPIMLDELYQILERYVGTE